jgi:hypothetical protein
VTCRLIIILIDFKILPILESQKAGPRGLSCASSYVPVVLRCQGVGRMCAGLDMLVIDTPGRTGAVDAEGEAVALQRYVERNVCLNHSPTQLFPKLTSLSSSPQMWPDPLPPLAHQLQKLVIMHTSVIPKRSRYVYTNYSRLLPATSYWLKILDALLWLNFHLLCGWLKGRIMGVLYLFYFEKEEKNPHDVCEREKDGIFC